jgi:hypothetical protein
VIESRDRYQIGDDRGQELVQHLVPYKLRGLLRELLSLAPQSAILRGWASEFPVLVKVNDPPRSKKPRSGDRWFARSQAQMIERMLRHAQARQQDLEKRLGIAVLREKSCAISRLVDCG